MLSYVNLHRLPFLMSWHDLSFLEKHRLLRSPSVWVDLVEDILCMMVDVAQCTHHTETLRLRSLHPDVTRVEGSINQILTRLLKINQSVSQSASQPASQPTNQSVNQSINQSINQSTNQSIYL